MQDNEHKQPSVGLFGSRITWLDMFWTFVRTVIFFGLCFSTPHWWVGVIIYVAVFIFLNNWFMVSVLGYELLSPID